MSAPEQSPEAAYADRAYDLVYQSGIGEFGPVVRDAIVDTAYMLAADERVELDPVALRAAAARLA